MPRKRDRPPEVVLRDVVKLLEESDEPGHRSHRAVVLKLLGEGPLLCRDTVLQELNHPDADVSLYRAELVKYLRDVVRLKDSQIWFPRISVGRVTYSASAMGPRVVTAAEGTARDLAVQQLIQLLEAVGIGQLRVCPSPPCMRLFVKTYRRHYCSVTCQKRSYARTLRRKEAQRRVEQEFRRRRIQKGRH